MPEKAPPTARAPRAPGPAARPTGPPPRARRLVPRPRALLTLLPLLALAALAATVARARLAEERPSAFVAPAVPSVRLPALVPPPAGATVRGAVRSASGAPVPDALVLARVEDLLSWTYTNAQGDFELEGLAPGAVLLRVCARRFEVEDFLVEAPSEGERLLLTNELGPPPSLPPIEREALAGEVVAPWPEWVVTGYEVVLVPEEPPETFGAPVPRRATVRPDRGVRFDELILGRYRVLVLPPWARGGTWPDLAAPDARELHHARSGVAARVVVPLEAGVLEATVSDAAGRPLEGALVLVHPEGQPGRLWPPAVTGEGGEFRVRDLPPGSYEVTVSAGEAEERRRVDVRAGATTRLDLPPLHVGPPR